MINLHYEHRNKRIYSNDRSSSKLSEVSETSDSEGESLKKINQTIKPKQTPFKDMKVFKHYSKKNNWKSKKMKLSRNQIQIRNKLISPMLKISLANRKHHLRF